LGREVTPHSTPLHAGGEEGARKGEEHGAGGEESALAGLQADGGLRSALTRWRSSHRPVGPRSANSRNSRHLFEFGQA
jgi:hypothetical protein